MLGARMRRLAVSLGLGLSLALGGRSSSAAEEPLVLLELKECEEFDEAEVRRALAAEIGARPTSTGGPEVTQITVTCDEAKVTIHVLDPISRKSSQRSFNLGLSDPRARGRIVALAASELVLASWAELEVRPKLEVEPEGPTPEEATTRAVRSAVRGRLKLAAPVPTPAAPPPYVGRPKTWYETDTPRDRAFRILAIGSTRSFFEFDGSMYGGGVRVGEERFRWVGWSGDVLIESGTIEERARSFEVRTVTVSGFLNGYLRSGNLTGRLGAGLRIGVAATDQKGVPDGEASSLAPWGWPLACASVSIRAGEQFVIDLATEAGYVVLPVAGPGDHTLRGAWLGTQLGLGIVLPDPG
jgi:hypothetical protein